MILVTGAAGFIGSCLVSELNKAGFANLILVDEFETKAKSGNLEGKLFHKKINRLKFISDIRNKKKFPISFVFHLGARTDTTEKNKAVFDQLNFGYSKSLWHYCTQFDIPFIYASSAATYGSGELGYEDRHDLVSRLKPLNPYGRSKNDFDLWALNQALDPTLWAGLRFFNVYGPNEYHKGRMASVIFHTFNQIQKTGKMRLFRSHRPDIEDGMQSRDFIYVKDVIRVCLHFLGNQNLPSGIFNVGTARARTFNDLAFHTFKAMGREPKIAYIDTPLDIRETYQYFTKADISKILKTGLKGNFYSLEDGISEYVRTYLMKDRYF